MDAIASVGFGIRLDAFGHESNDFVLSAKSIFDNLIGFGAKMNGNCL
jgi:hypothetical protein